MENSKPRAGLPLNARRVFKGVIFEVWQWDQNMFDGTTEIFEKIWRIPTVEVVAIIGDKILIEKQDQPDRPNNINLPGGRVNEGEDPLDGAKRELLEETGYYSDDWSLLLKHNKSGKIIQEVYYFLARNCKKTREPQLDAGEKIKTQLITFDDFILLTENSRFWVSPEFVNYLLRVQLDQNRENELRELLFRN